MADPTVPSSSVTQPSTVGLPRESRTSWAVMCLMSMIVSLSLLFSSLPSLQEHQQHDHGRLRLDRVLQFGGHVDPGAGLSILHVVAQADARLALHEVQHGRFRRCVFGIAKLDAWFLSLFRRSSGPCAIALCLFLVPIHPHHAVIATVTGDVAKKAFNSRSKNVLA